MGRIAGLFIAFLVLGLVFGVLERVWPSVRGQRVFRAGYKTDLAWWLWTPLVNQTVAFLAVVLAVIAMARVAGVPVDREHIRAWASRDTFFSGQRGWLQAIEGLLWFDLVGYWSHRAFHELETLWRFHSVHHSPTEVDWLSSVRVHPVNEIGQRVVQAVPLVLAGYNPAVLAAYVPILTLYAIMLHANVDWDFGRLRYVLASPIYHRWHHTSEQEGLNRNYAGMFPWLDRLFGTMYFPRHRRPTVFGVAGERLPNNLLKQLAYPFRRKGIYRTPALAAK
jgi:sterol desaturase/sphingolipid hydroxylase (fatty acid hydroxylase superfamily)